MSDITKTPREELECKKKYLYEHSMFWECKYHSKNQILEEDVCDLLNIFSSEIEELNISISLFEDDVARMSKKIGEQQATITELERKVKKYAKIGEEQLKQIMELQDLCGQSDSENMKLRIENKSLCDEIRLLKPTNVEQYEQIVQLQEENEKLKNRLNNGL